MYNPFKNNQVIKKDLPLDKSFSWKKLDLSTEFICWSNINVHYHSQLIYRDFDILELVFKPPGGVNFLCEVSMFTHK